MLDLNTASPFLGVSADLQTAERMKTKLDYPNSNSPAGPLPGASPLVTTSGRWRLRDTGTSPCHTRASNVRARTAMDAVLIIDFVEPFF